MKNKFAVLIAATFVATFASAGGFESQVFANDNIKAIELLQTEMQETQGKWGPVGAVVGGIGGGAGYLLNQQISGSKFSPTTLAWATGAGAAAGATSGPAGVVWAFNGALAGGMVTGVAQRYGW